MSNHGRSGKRKEKKPNIPSSSKPVERTSEGITPSTNVELEKLVKSIKAEDDAFKDIPDATIMQLAEKFSVSIELSKSQMHSGPLHLHLNHLMLMIKLFQEPLIEY